MRKIYFTLFFLFILCSCSLFTTQPARQDTNLNLNINSADQSTTYRNEAKGLEIKYPTSLNLKEETDGTYFSEQIEGKSIDQFILGYNIDTTKYRGQDSQITHENKTIGDRQFYIQKFSNGYDLYYPNDLEVEILVSPQYKNKAEAILATLKNTFIHETFSTEEGFSLYALGYIKLDKTNEYYPVLALRRPNENNIKIYAVIDNQLQDLDWKLPDQGKNIDFASAALSYDGTKLAYIDTSITEKEVVKILDLINNSVVTLASPGSQGSKITINRLLVWDDAGANLLIEAHIINSTFSQLLYSVNISSNQVTGIFGADNLIKISDSNFIPVGFYEQDQFFSMIDFGAGVKEECSATINHIIDDTVNETKRIRAVISTELNYKDCKDSETQDLFIARIIPKSSDVIYWFIGNDDSGHLRSFYLNKDNSEAVILAQAKWPLHSSLNTKFSLSGDGKKLLYIQDYGDVGFFGAQVYNLDIATKAKALIYQLDVSYMP